MKKENHLPQNDSTPSAVPVMGEPVDVWDQVNKYGTYECQDTTETDNTFPLIGPLGAGVSGVPLPDIPDADSKNSTHKTND